MGSGHRTDPRCLTDSTLRWSAAPENCCTPNHLTVPAKEQGVELTGPNGLLNQLTKNVLETALDAEMTEHLGYERHEAAGRGSGNSRNGTRSKTVLTEIGPVEIDVPRDVDSSFMPQIVKKRQRRLTGIDEIVLSLTAKGLTTGEVSAHFQDVYGATVSKDTISRITDKVVGEMTEWQNRPLDRGWFPLIEANPFPRGFRCPDMRGTRHRRRANAATSS
ncbi:transposase [Rhodococcus erythropolis]|uniref:transposase n=1 Tax=Rhodococcus erythropolis TaxID=1833 RepID=UPI003981FF29